MKHSYIPVVLNTLLIASSVDIVISYPVRSFSDAWSALLLRLEPDEVVDSLDMHRGVCEATASHAQGSR